LSIRKQELSIKRSRAFYRATTVLQLKSKERLEEAQQRINVDRERIETQEDIAELRDDTARARMEQQARFKILDLQR
jgi:hypothetical protein